MKQTNQMINEMLDIKYHIKEQNLNINVENVYQANYEQHKFIYGSLKQYQKNKINNIYQQKISKRHKYIINEIWNCVESKIKCLNKMKNESGIKQMW